MNNIIDTLEKAAHQAVGGMADQISAAAIEQRLWEAYRDLGRQAGGAWLSSPYAQNL